MASSPGHLRSVIVYASILEILSKIVSKILDMIVCITRKQFCLFSFYTDSCLPPRLHHTKLPQYMREMKKYHLAHHYKNFELGYGVTSEPFAFLFILNFSKELCRQNMGLHLRDRASSMRSDTVIVLWFLNEFRFTTPGQIYLLLELLIVGWQPAIHLLHLAFKFSVVTSVLYPCRLMFQHFTSFDFNINNLMGIANPF